MSSPLPDSPSALHSPAAERNKQPILEALQALLPPSGRALEIASGSGQHIAHFAAGLPGWLWLASDPSPEARASIAAWWPQGPAALALDVQDADWGLPAGHLPLDLIHCANMLHISPWSSSTALFQGASRHLAETGLLTVYGPFVVPSEPTAPSNLAFDGDLRSRNPAWGLRSLDEVQACAHDAGLQLRQRLKLPANNLLLVFARQA
jgi:hypothetical protein